MAQRTTAFAGATQLLDRDVRTEIRLAWRLLRDPRVSGLKYALPALLALYVFSPVDAIPDLLPGLGQLDDVGAVVAMVVLLAKLLPWLAPKDVVAEHARDMAGGVATSERDVRAAVQVIETPFSVRR
jgi:uncharacterized membrane protein YkvA (DUF1232 family)